MNPLNAVKKRELNFIPAHFVKVPISKYKQEEIHNWVTHKLTGRFCIIEAPIIDQNQKLTSSTIVAFENHSELTYFMLAYPHT